jgi:3-oxoacyl-[acyl-carrier-protein] synthase-3
MIGIESIASYIPAGRIDNMIRATDLGSSPEQVTNKIGFTSVAIKHADESTVSMAHKAVINLVGKTNIALNTIEVLVFVTQNPDRAIPHASADLHGVLGLAQECACFDVGLGCSGYVYGLSIISSFMQANGFKRGILITADPYSSIINPDDKNTSLIFGDAATATLLSDNPCFELGQFTFGTQGAHADQLALNDQYLYMNGRAVFTFTASYVPETIRQVASKNNHTLDTIDLFILHQGSKYIVDTIADRLKVPAEKVPFLSTEYGNTVSSSIPLILEQYLNDIDIKAALLCGFGLGFSWGSTVISRKEKM